MPLTVHVPLLETVVVTAVDEFEPFLATTEIVAPASPVPLAVVLLTFVVLIALVTDVMATAGAVVSVVLATRPFDFNWPKEFPPPELSTVLLPLPPLNFVLDETTSSFDSVSFPLPSATWSVVTSRLLRLTSSLSLPERMLVFEAVVSEIEIASAPADVRTVNFPLISRSLMATESFPPFSLILTLPVKPLSVTEPLALPLTLVAAPVFPVSPEMTTSPALSPASTIIAFDWLSPRMIKSPPEIFAVTFPANIDRDSSDSRVYRRRECFFFDMIFLENELRQE